MRLFILTFCVTLTWRLSLQFCRNNRLLTRLRPASLLLAKKRASRQQQTSFERIENRNSPPFGVESGEIFYDDLKSDLPRFVKAIRERSHGDLSSTEVRNVQSLLETHIPNMNGPTFSSIALSIGTAYNNAKSPWNSAKELVLLQQHIPRVADTLTPYEVVSIIVGLARLQASWDDIKRISIISTRLGEMLPRMDERSVGDAVWSLGVMGAKWEELSGDLQKALVAAIERKGELMNSYSLSSTLWALAKLGFKWSQLSTQIKQSLPRRLVEMRDVMSPQQSSKVIWALGSLGVSASALPNLLIEYHVINVGKIKKSQLGTAVPASQTLTGLAKMGTLWRDLSLPTRTAIWDHLVRISQSPNDRGTANAIWAMGSMGAPVKLQPKVVQDIMLAAAEKVAKECSPWALCNIVWGLAKMDYQWPDLPKGFRDSVMQNVERMYSGMNSVDTGILLWSLGVMDAPLDTLQNSFVEALLTATKTNLESMRAQELSRTIWGLSLGGLSWDALPGPLRWGVNVALRRVEDSMTAQDVANCAYGLAILSFDTQTPSDPAYRGAHEALLSMIRRQQARKANTSTATTMNEQELEQIRIFSHYLNVMNVITDSRRIPEELLKFAVSYGGVQTWKSAAVAAAQATAAAEEPEGAGALGSRLQRRIIRSLQDAFTASELNKQYEIAVEESSFSGVFPIDAMISKKGKGVVALLEVDGPHHYRADGKLRRKDLLKEMMYLKIHPSSSFHRIRWDEANKLGSDIVGEELAALVMSSSRDVDPFTAFSRSIQKSIQSFITWGLRNSNDL